jgi:hypothetical protein
MTKISALPSNTTPALIDTIPIVSSGVTNKMTISDLKALIAPQQTRRAEMAKTSDATGGVSISQQEANEIAFTGTPANYGRLNVMVPMDYVANTNINVKLFMYGTGANNQGMNFYLGLHTPGQTLSSWNIQNNANTASGVNLTANVFSTFTLYTISGASITAGANVTIALRPNAAITGSIYISSAYLEYTASV